MTAWEIGVAANALVAIAYLGITGAIVVPLARHGQLRTNLLGTATAAIFFTCAVHHGSHSVHMLLPLLSSGEHSGLAMRASYDPFMALWDVVTAAVGVYYWTLRRTYGSLTRGAQLFQDMRGREQQALELNDGVLQGLVVAKMAVELGAADQALEALDGAITSASALITGLMGTGARDLTRSRPASLESER